MSAPDPVHVLTAHDGLRNSLIQELTKAGYVVHAYSDYQLFIEQLPACPRPSVLVLDMNFPNAPAAGLKVHAALDTVELYMPVLYVLTDAILQDVVAAHERSPQGLFHKYYCDQELLDAVAHAMVVSHRVANDPDD